MVTTISASPLDACPAASPSPVDLLSTPLRGAFRHRCTQRGAERQQRRCRCRWRHRRTGRGRFASPGPFRGGFSSASGCDRTRRLAHGDTDLDALVAAAVNRLIGPRSATFQLAKGEEVLDRQAREHYPTLSCLPPRTSTPRLQDCHHRQRTCRGRRRTIERCACITRWGLRASAWPARYSRVPTLDVGMFVTDPQLDPFRKVHHA